MSDIRVLVVEDEPIAAAAHAAYIGRLGGFTLAGTAPDGQSALRLMTDFAAAGTPVDLVLLDMNLPDLHGLDIARRMRAAGLFADIIAITAVLLALSGGDRRRQHLVEPSDRLHHGVRQVEHRALLLARVARGGRDADAHEPSVAPSARTQTKAASNSPNSAALRSHVNPAARPRPAAVRNRAFALSSRGVRIAGRSRTFNRRRTQREHRGRIMRRAITRTGVSGSGVWTGLLTVVSRLLGDEGVGVVETYVVRTALAAIDEGVPVPVLSAALFERALRGERGDRGRYDDGIEVLAATSLCGHGRGLAEFAESLNRHFPQELGACFD